MGKTRKAQPLVQSQAPAHFNDHELKIISQTPAAFNNIESMDTSFHKDASSDSSSDSAFTEPKTLYIRLLSNTSDRAFYEKQFNTLSPADKKLLKSVIEQLDAHHILSQENQKQLNRLMNHMGFELLSSSVDQQGLYEVPVSGTETTYAVPTDDNMFYEIPVSGEDNNYEEIPGIAENPTHILVKPKKPALPTIYDTAEPSKERNELNQPLYDQADPLLKKEAPPVYDQAQPAIKNIASLYDRADPAPKTQTTTAALYDLAESLPRGKKAQNTPTYDLASSNSKTSLLPKTAPTDSHEAEYGFQESVNNQKTNTLSSGNYELELPNHSEQGALPSEFYDNIASLDYAAVVKKGGTLTLAGSPDESDDFGFDEDKNGYIQMAPDTDDNQELYTVADNNKPAPVAPLLPARPSLLKKFDNKVDHPVPTSSLLAADTTLEPQQQVLIESILNLIRTYQPIEENIKQSKKELFSKNKVAPVVYPLSQENNSASADTPNLLPIPGKLTDKKNPPAPQQGIFTRRNILIFLALLAVIGVIFTIYWLTRASSSDPGSSDSEELSACKRASKIAADLGAKLVNNLFSVTASQENTICTEAKIPVTEQCSSFLTKTCSQLFSQDASSSSGSPTQQFFGFAEDTTTTTTTTTTAPHVFSTTTSKLAHVASTTTSTLADAATTTATTLANAVGTTTTTLIDAATTVTTTLADAVTTTTTTLLDAATTTSTTLANAVGTTTTTLIDAATTATTTLADVVSSTTSTLIDAATTTTSSIANAISSTTTTLANATSTTTSSIANAISSTTSTLLDAATTTTSSITNAISSTTTTLTDAATTAASSIANAISSTTTTLADAATTTTSSIANAISSTTATLADAITTTTSSIANAVSSTTSTIAKTTTTFFQAPTTTTTTTHLTTTPGCLFSTCNDARIYTSSHPGAPGACACAMPVIPNCPRLGLFGC